MKWWFYLVHWVKIFPSPRGQYWTYSEPRCREKYQGILLTCYAQGARQVYYVWCRAGLHSVFVLRISKLYHDWKLLVIRALTLNASYGWVYLMGHWCFGWIFPFIQFTKKVQVGRTSLLWVWRAMPLVNHNLMTVLVFPWSYSYHMHLYM